MACPPAYVPNPAQTECIPIPVAPSKLKIKIIEMNNYIGWVPFGTVITLKAAISDAFNGITSITWSNLEGLPANIFQTTTTNVVNVKINTANIAANFGKPIHIQV
jgi:hypothetical protein